MVKYSWLALAACSSPSAAVPDAGTSDAAECTSDAPDLCAGTAGTFHDQTIMVNGEARHFYVHVPARAIGEAAPLVIDFHGTGFVDDRPEEEWGIPEMEAVSDDLGFIVVRPRSHSYVSGTETIYQWDLDAADLAGNLALAGKLVDLIETRYRIDPQRVYTAGFSNGTNMAVQTLGMATNPFHGIGLVGGGIYYPFAHTTWPEPAPRIYDTTGYRDLNYEFQRDLSSWLQTNNYPMGSLWIRETKAVHELRGWHYREMFAWLDAGVAPTDGALAAGWATETVASQSSSLLSLATASDGHLIASAADGSIWSRSTTGWTATRTATTPVLVSACLDGTGGGYATGETANFSTHDDGATWQAAPDVPHTTNAPAASQLFAIGCSGATRVGGGAAFTASSTDRGATWNAVDTEDFMFGIRRGASGAWVAVGINYVGRSADGTSFSEQLVDPELYDLAEAAPGSWWAVGVDGAMMHSTDDGQTWAVITPIVDDALYAIRFASPLVGMAVGEHGTTVVTTDGGATWTRRSTGLDRMLGDVTWLDVHHAIVVGARGLALELSL